MERRTRSHEFEIKDGLFPGVDSGLLEGVVIVICSVAPEVAFQIVPEGFDRIEFRTVRRQLHEGGRPQ